MRILTFTGLLLAGLMSCSSGITPDGGGTGGEGGGLTPGKKDLGSYVTYVSTADKKQLLDQKKSDFIAYSPELPHLVQIDATKTYQTIDGFGAALTGASCYNMLKMSKDARTDLLKEFFDTENGLGISLIRVSIGASDFSVDEDFTWCDKEGLDNFAVHKEDRDYLFPVLKEVFSINPNVKIIASPWSAPRWMKTSDSWTSAGLDKAYYDVYAHYFVKWIQTMEKEGFPIYAMTIQNEPLNKGNSMSMYMTWKEQAEFIKNDLGPAFKEAGIKTKILVFDHNYNYDNIESQKKYPLNIFADKDASQYVAGSAWHNYGGNVSELADIVKNAPEKEIFFTEASIGTWNYDFAKCLVEDFKSIFIQTLNYNNKGVTLWNFALDENRKPYRPGGCSTCYGVVEINSGTHSVTARNSHYYDIAHASKVVKQGAVRIDASGYSANGVLYSAFKNPDGTVAILAVNQTTEIQALVFRRGEKAAAVTMPASSIASVLLPAE